MKKLRLKKSDIVMAAIFALLLIINLLSWLSTAFSDFYVQKIYPIYSALPIRLSGLLPFSLGEIMIIALVAATILGIPALIAVSVIKRQSPKLLKKMYSVVIRLLLWIIVLVFLCETLGCFVMYHCTGFSERYFQPVEHNEELLLDTLKAVSLRIGDLAGKFERDADGYIILSEDPADKCREAMRQLGEEYSQLRGYYPRPKKIINSFFMSQEGIIGLYIPFAFEATYNRDIQPIAAPATICHELAHLKGIIQEDEASFVAVVACLNYGTDELKYSACLDAFYYLYRNALELRGTDYEDRLWQSVAAVPAQAWDNDFGSYTADYWEKNSEKEIIPTETVAAISEKLTDANLTLNGVSDGINAYNRVVELLMDYYGNGGFI